MSRLIRRVAVVVAVLVATPLIVAVGGSTALACSCASIDPVDAVRFADVVFTGRPSGNLGSSNEPIWSFEVDGVVEGDIGPTATVYGEDWGGGCGTDFGQFSEAVVVYATRSGDRLNAVGCMPTPTAAAFAAQLAALGEPSGTGPPRAVMVGTHHASDIAVLDGRGRTIARTNLDLAGAAVAHCRGTSRVAVVSTDSSEPMKIVDLATLSVVEERRIGSGFVSVTGDRIACLDGGSRVVTASGYGPDTGSVVVAVSNSAGAGGDGVRRSFDGVSRAVVHDAGTVLLLPTTVGDPIRAISATDLEPIGADVEFPDGASTLDADVSPDGSALAVLATLSGRPAQWDTGASHVIVVDLVDGVPVADSAAIIALVTPSGDIESGDGAAKWIRWVDGETWVIEYETSSTKKATFVATDGTQLLAPTDVGWGWGLVPLDSGVLRARNGGLEIVARDGTSIAGDPAPSDGYVDRMLALDRLVDAPPFDVPVVPLASLSITPVEDASDVDATPRADPAPGAATATGSPDAAGSRVLRWIAGGLSLMVLAVLGLTMRRRRLVSHIENDGPG